MTNELLDSLLHGQLPEAVLGPTTLEAEERLEVPESMDDEERELAGAQSFLTGLGLPPGERGYELADEGAGDAIAAVDLAWPDRVQAGFTDPVALLIDEPHEVHEAAVRAGFRAWASTVEFEAYVMRVVGDGTHEMG